MELEDNKELAVCIKCGALKESPYGACLACNFNPVGDLRAKAQSYFLSTSFYNEKLEQFKTIEELKKVSASISRGETVEWDEEAIEGLIAHQKIHGELRDIGLFRITVSVLVRYGPQLLLVIGILGLMIASPFLIKYFNK